MPRSKHGTTPFGDFNAPSNSVAYAVAIKIEAQGALNSWQSDVQQLEQWLSMLRAENRYQRLESPTGRSFMSWEDFCTAAQPFGLGYSPTAISHLITERKAAKAIAADPTVTPLATHGTNQHGDGGGSVRTSSRGETATYLIRRLKRDAPEVAAALARGEHPSARAAAIVAGIVKVPSVLEQLQKLWTKATPKQRAAFLTFTKGGRDH